jgi:uncharacterized protein (UPF0332 family)
VSDVVRQLALHRLDSAREALRDGELLLSQGLLTSAADRFCCGAFHAARALLATRGVDTSHHRRVMTLFRKHFVGPNLIDPKIAEALLRAFLKQQKGDSGHFFVLTRAEVERTHNNLLEALFETSDVLTRAEAEDIRDSTTAFVEACGRLLDTLTEGPEGSAT